MPWMLENPDVKEEFAQWSVDSPLFDAADDLPADRVLEDHIAAHAYKVLAEHGIPTITAAVEAPSLPGLGKIALTKPNGGIACCSSRGVTDDLLRSG